MGMEMGGGTDTGQSEELAMERYRNCYRLCGRRSNTMERTLTIQEQQLDETKVCIAAIVTEQRGVPQLKVARVLACRIRSSTTL